MWRKQGEALSVETHHVESFYEFMSDVLLRIERLCAGLPRQQMCGFISLWREGGMFEEMQQQRGE